MSTHAIFLLNCFYQQTFRILEICTSVDTQNITSVCWVQCKRLWLSAHFKNKGATRISRSQHRPSKSISQVVAVVKWVWVLTVCIVGVPLVTGSECQWVETQHRSLLQVTSQTENLNPCQGKLERAWPLWCRRTEIWGFKRTHKRGHTKWQMRRSNKRRLGGQEGQMEEGSILHDSHLLQLPSSPSPTTGLAGGRSGSVLFYGFVWRVERFQQSTAWWSWICDQRNVDKTESSIGIWTRPIRYPLRLPSCLRYRLILPSCLDTDRQDGKINRYLRYLCERYRSEEYRVSPGSIGKLNRYLLMTDNIKFTF